MIRNNDATELCITKSQEGFIAGWTSHNGVHGKEVLDTLFVKLDKPAKSVKIVDSLIMLFLLLKGSKL